MVARIHAAKNLASHSFSCKEITKFFFVLCMPVSYIFRYDLTGSNIAVPKRKSNIVPKNAVLKDKGPLFVSLILFFCLGLYLNLSPFWQRLFSLIGDIPRRIIACSRCAGYASTPEQ